MPNRVMYLPAAMAGLLIVVGLLLVGSDPHRAARTGPRWRRRIVAAALLLLGLLGIGPGLVPGVQTVDAAAPTSVSPSVAFGQTAEWKALVATWRTASEVASGVHGAYPFTAAGKARLLAQIEQGKTQVVELRDAGALTAAESDLLISDLDILARGVNAKRSVDMKLATCYEPMMVVPSRDAMKRLAGRLPLLKKIAAADALNVTVLGKVLETVEVDLVTLSRDGALDALTAQERVRADELRKGAATVRQAIANRVRGDAESLDEAPEWKNVTAAWKLAAPLAKSGKSTNAQRLAADAQLKAARTAATKLAVAGLLTTAEAGLLHSEADRLREGIYRNPPTDCQVMCYDMMFIDPAQTSLKRLSVRLPLLQRLAAGGKVSKAAIARVLPSVEADAKLLGDAERLTRLSDDERQRVEVVRRQAAEALATIRKVLAAQE
jgi:hypothetical protein